MNKNNNSSLSMLFAVASFSLMLPSTVAADSKIDRSDKAEAACQELSEESLNEFGLTPTNWRAHTTNDSDGFSIEGRWQTQNGVYLVECVVGFGKTFDDVDVSITKD